MTVLTFNARAPLKMRESYYELHQALSSIEAEEHAYGSVLGYLKMVKETLGPQGARIFFVGNGGSAAIASHMAADFQKNGHMPTMCFNDAASLTCISNDIAFDTVFANPLAHHARWGDVLFAISSSGMSENIIRAATYGARHHMNVVTLSGFDPGNDLRKLGSVNFYVPSRSYGTVETAHLAILHSLLDETMK